VGGRLNLSLTCAVADCLSGKLLVRHYTNVLSFTFYMLHSIDVSCRGMRR